MLGLLTAIPFAYRWLALVALAIALFGYGWLKGANHGEARLNAYISAQDKAILAQVQKSAQKTANLQSDAEVLEGVKNDQIDAINKRLAAAVADGVRYRAERRADLPTNTGTCEGATGANLSRPDAEAFSRLAADADRQRAALEQCYAAYDKARAAIN
jgi:hypothetical protein